MCGITGIWSKNKIDHLGYYDSHLQIKHRGPDDEGFVYLDQEHFKFAKGDDTIDFFQHHPHIKNSGPTNLILGHRRLSILDLTENGHQPMIYEHLSMIFNGEIFNFKNLRNELIKEGYSFNSNSDTEVVIKGYHFWGEAILEKMDGMWSIAIYDNKLKQLFITRDNFGIKPLYYAISNTDTFLFSSEIKFITSYNPEFRKANLNKVKLYLDHLKQDIDHETFFKNIYQVKPGYFMKIDSELKIQETQYYELKISNSKLNSTNIYNKLENLLNDSLRSRLLSDVKVGSLLSGGLDSNVIVSNLAKHNIITKNNFEAFSAVYNDGSKIDEFEFVEATKEKYNLNVHYIKPEIENLSHTIDQLLFHIEEPFRSLSVFAQLELYKKIRNSSDVRVVMNGQGSDEIFGGYHHHLLFGLGDNFGKFHWLLFIKNLKFINFKMNLNHFKMLTKYCFRAIFSRHFFNYQLRKEVNSSPLPEYLKYDDRTSMAYGIEARPPFLSKDLVNFAFTVPLNYKIYEGQGKYLLRHISIGTVADKILNRKDKLGFVTPQEAWMQSNLKDEILKTLKEFDFESQEIASNAEINELIVKYDQNKVHWQKVWQYYITAKWYQKWIM